jgi:hypothetical protein
LDVHSPSSAHLLARFSACALIRMSQVDTFFKD